MQRYNFPYNYKPKISLEDTYLYSSYFYQYLINFFTKKYDAHLVVAPHATSFSKNIKSYSKNVREICFDNLNTNQIFLINQNVDTYLMSLSNIFKDKALICLNQTINRDAKLTNVDSIVNIDLHLEIPSLISHQTTKHFSNLILQIFADIVQVMCQNELLKIYQISSSKKTNKKYVCVGAQKIENDYPFFKLENAFDHFCSQSKKNVIVLDSLKQLKSENFFKQPNFVSQNLNASCSLYVFDNNSQKAINLIDITSRPSGQQAKDQLLKYNTVEFDQKIYDPGLFSSSRPQNTSIVIHCSNVLFYFLDKIHLAEVVKSVWTDDFIDFCEINKIKIM